jgi:hypothetical protein
MANIIERINRIKQILSNDTLADLQEITDALGEPVLKSYIIQYLSGNFKPDWFYFLYENGAFSFDQIPAPVIFTDNDGKESRGFNAWEACFVIWEAAKYDENKGNLIPYLTDLIDRYIVYVKKEAESPNRNIRIDYYFSQFIMLLPETALKQDYFQFLIDYGLKSDRSVISRDLSSKFFAKALTWKNKTMAFHLLDLFFTPVSDQSDFKMKSIVDGYYLESFAKKTATPIYQAVGTSAVEWLVGKIKTLVMDNAYQFLKFSIPSLEVDSQNNSREGMNTAIVELLIRTLQLVDDSSLKSRVAQFIDDNIPIFKRIGFYFVDQRYETYKDLFWTYPNPLKDREIKLEIYRLLNRHCVDFTEKQLLVVYQWIVDLTIPAELEKETNKEKYLAYEKLEWVLALEPVRYRTVILRDLYNELKAITEGQLPRHPGYDSYFEIRPGGDYSKTNRIIGMAPTAMLNILANEKEWNGYDRWGLEQDVHEYVLLNANLVLENAKHFFHITPNFLYNFIDGFRTLAERKTSLDYFKVLVFFSDVVKNRRDLWDFSTEGREKSNAIGMLAWFIESVVQDNELGLEKPAVQLASSVLVTAEGKYDIAFEWLNDDPGFDIINSTRGKLYKAMIASSMRENKLNGDLPGFWNAEIESCFTRRLTDQSNYVEFFWSIGFYTPQISYLNFEWLSQHKNEIYIQRPEFGGDVAFLGYLLFSSRVYTNIFELLRDRYEFALQHPLPDGQTKKRLVEHIYVAYVITLSGSDKLMELLLEKRDLSALSNLIDRISNPDVDITDDITIGLWGRLLDIAENTNDRNFKKAISRTTEFIEIIKNIDTRTEKLFETALGYFESGTPTYRLFKAVESKVDGQQAEAAGRLLILLLMQLSGGTYLDDEMVNNLIKKLYELNLRRLADKAAIEAVMRKDFGAVDIYNKFHDEKKAGH